MRMIHDRDERKAQEVAYDKAVEKIHTDYTRSFIYWVLKKLQSHLLSFFSLVFRPYLKSSGNILNLSIKCYKLEFISWNTIIKSKLKCLKLCQWWQWTRIISCYQLSYRIEINNGAEKVYYIFQIKGGGFNWHLFDKLKALQLNFSER